MFFSCCVRRFVTSIFRLTYIGAVFCTASVNTGWAQTDASPAGVSADFPSKRASWLAPVAAAVVPGSGQALLGQQRSIGYLVAEGFLVIRAVRARRDANDARTRYRSIAADVARLEFGADRPVGTWDYYETLEHYPASGEYDVAVGGKFTPEPDPTTYNGRIWYQARSTYWASPEDAPIESSAEYQRALAFYKERAVSGSFRWSWRDQQLAQQAYVQTIRESNRSKQNLVSAVGLVAANHLVSLVDAYITVRLRRYGGAGLVGASLQTEVMPAGRSIDGALAGLGNNRNGAADGYVARLHLTLPIPSRR